MKRQILCIFLAAASVYSAREAAAQDIIDRTPLRAKYDTVNWDKVSLPPSDPYELSYAPARPDQALDISDEKSCVDNGGKWPSKLAFNEYHDLYGCKINGEAVGLWSFVTKNRGQVYQTTPPKNVINGYVWFVKGKKEGEAVQYQSPEQNFLKSVIEYSADEIDGNELEWGENGQLVYYNHYSKGEMDGETARFNDHASPEYYGSYFKGKPSETWYLYHPMFGGLEYKKEYQKEAPEALTKEIGEFERLVWTVEYDVISGKKKTEGYRLERTDSDPAVVGSMYKTQTFYDANGEKWLDIEFDRDSVVIDPIIIELCSGYKDYNFDHNERQLSCLDEKNDEGKVIRYYSTGEIRYIEERKQVKNRKELWSHTEYHKNGEYLTEPSAYLFERTMPIEIDDNLEYLDIVQGEVIYLAPSNKERESRAEYGRCSISEGTGQWIAYWHNGKIREKGEWKDGKRNGTWEYYGENGSKYRSVEYKDGQKWGTEMFWFDDGMPDRIKHYAYGKPVSSFKGYYTLGGLAWEATYKQTVNLKSDEPIVYTEISGHYKEYSGTGALVKDQDFTRPRNPITLYYSNGKVRAKGFDSSVSDTRDGKWKLYLLDGTFWREVEYDQGVPVGPNADKCKNEGGEYVIDEENRVEGCYLSMVNRDVVTHPDKLRYGKWRWWDEHGALQREGEFNLGHLDGHWAYYYPGGKIGVEADKNYIMLEGEFSLDRPVGVWRGYYIGYKPKFSGSYDVDGKEKGEWTTFYENGQKSSYGEYDGGKRIGSWVWYYENGKVKDEGAYSDGLEEGKWTSYYENGQKFGEGEFKAGKREGHWIWWKEDGKVWRENNYIKGKDQSMK